MSNSPETDALADLLLSKCSHSESCYYEMRILARRLERERDEWKSKFIQQNRDLGCEMMDPGGTIWDYAKRLQLELNEVKSDLEFRRDLYKLQTERINAMQTYAYLKENKQHEQDK